jgi:hypothetical protein
VTPDLSRGRVYGGHRSPCRLRHPGIVVRMAGPSEPEGFVSVSPTSRTDASCAPLAVVGPWGGAGSSGHSRGQPRPASALSRASRPKVPGSVSAARSPPASPGRHALLPACRFRLRRRSRYPRVAAPGTTGCGPYHGGGPGFRVPGLSGLSRTSAAPTPSRRVRSVWGSRGTGRGPVPAITAPPWGISTIAVSPAGTVALAPFKARVVGQPAAPSVIRGAAVAPLGLPDFGRVVAPLTRGTRLAVAAPLAGGQAAGRATHPTDRGRRLTPWPRPSPAPPG